MARVVGETLLDLNIERSLLAAGHAWDQVRLGRGIFFVDNLGIYPEWEGDINQVLHTYCKLVEGQSRYRRWRLG